MIVMNYNQENNTKTNLQKEALVGKERAILLSQIKKNKIENKIKRLELKKENICRGKQQKLTKFISSIIYSVLMLTVIILFVTNHIEKNLFSTITNIKIYIAQIYIGVMTISIAGAYISAKIEDIIIKYYYSKQIVKILKKIRNKYNELYLEIDKQELLKKEITAIMNSFDNITKSEVSETYKNIDNYCNKVDINKQNESNINNNLKIKKKIKTNI